MWEGAEVLKAEVGVEDRLTRDGTRARGERDCLPLVLLGNRSGV